ESIWESNSFTVILSLFLLFILNAENKFMGIIIGRRIISNIANMKNSKGEYIHKAPFVNISYVNSYIHFL
ncbi:hypothetical protein CF056_18425, partial [Clostridium botulinum]